MTNGCRQASHEVKANPQPSPQNLMSCTTSANFGGASEHRLHAATEGIGIATADLFPRVSFAGLLGVNELHEGTAFDGISPVNLAALNIDWSFLDRGRVRARIAASRADGGAQLAQYQQSVLLALEDVENALVSYARSQDRDAPVLAANQTAATLYRLQKLSRRSWGRGE
jgi:outer membrane protein TolC